MPRVADPCRTGLVQGDTVQLIGFTLTHRPMGKTLLWLDSAGRIHYQEAVVSFFGTSSWDGEIALDRDALPTEFVTRYSHNGVLLMTETVARVGDSIVTERNSRRSALHAAAGIVPMATSLLAPVSLVVGKCAAHRPDHQLATIRFGAIRVDTAASIILRNGKEKKTITLSALVSDSVRDLGRVWLDGRGRLFASWDPGVGGAMLPADWGASLDQLVSAEVRIAEPRMRDTYTELSETPLHGVAFVHARVMDVRRGTAADRMSVLVRGSRIVSVTADSAFVPPAGALVIDAAGKTLMPGLWDLSETRMANAEAALSDRISRDLLSRGITTVQETNGDSAFTPAVAQRIALGHQIGPAVIPLCVVRGWIPDTLTVSPFWSLQGQVRDHADVVRLIRGCSERGVRWLKVVRVDPPLLPDIIAEAHRLHLRVMSDTQQGLSTQELLDRGVDGMSHAFQTLAPFFVTDTNRTNRLLGRVGDANNFWVAGSAFPALDLASAPVREMIRRLAEKHVPLFTALCAYPPANTNTPTHDTTYDAASFQKLVAYFQALRSAGANILIGSTGACSIVRELELLHSAGFTNAALLNLVTLGAAQYDGQEVAVGTIEPGKRADIILVDGDPLANLGDLRRIQLVMKGSSMYRDPQRLRRDLPFLPQHAASGAPFRNRAPLANER